MDDRYVCVFYGLFPRQAQALSRNIAEKDGLSYIVGNVLSSDTFYNDEAYLPETMRSTPQWAKVRVLAVEMEAAALYMNAAYNHRNALAIMTISDHFISGEKASLEDRERNFTDMMKLALETAVK